MSHDSDSATIWREHRRDQQRAREWRRARNRQLMHESRVRFTEANGGEVLMFRGDGVRADFFPSTGRWRVLGCGKTKGGGAAAFLAWLRKRISP